MPSLCLTRRGLAAAVGLVDLADLEVLGLALGQEREGRARALRLAPALEQDDAGVVLGAAVRCRAGEARLRVVARDRGDGRARRQLGGDVRLDDRSDLGGGGLLGLTRTDAADRQQERRDDAEEGGSAEADQDPLLHASPIRLKVTDRRGPAGSSGPRPEPRPSRRRAPARTRAGWPGRTSGPSPRARGSPPDRKSTRLN